MPKTVPEFGGIVGEKKSPFRPAVMVPVALAFASLAGVLLYLRSTTAPPPAAAPAFPPVAAASPVAPPAPAAGQAADAAPAPASYQTPNTGTTLVIVTSTPSGAEVRDIDDRLLGMTPFDLRVPTAKPLKLTLRYEGYKPLVLSKKPDGERMPLAVTLKKDSKADQSEFNKRSVGYKDDPY
jgi:hypothetical protein